MAFEPNPRLGKTIHGMDRILMGFKEANSQTFKKGQLVYPTSAATGALTACASDATLVLGRALVDATNVSSGNIEIPVEAWYPGDEVIMPCTSGGTATASSSFYPGTAYGLYVASNICYADLADTTNELFVFLEPIANADGSTSYWGRFTPKAVVAIGTGV
jgi:hypothetical protein